MKRNWWVALKILVPIWTRGKKLNYSGGGSLKVKSPMSPMLKSIIGRRTNRWPNGWRNKSRQVYSYLQAASLNYFCLKLYFMWFTLKYPRLQNKTFNLIYTRLERKNKSISEFKFLFFYIVQTQLTTEIKEYVSYCNFPIQI